MRLHSVFWSICCAVFITSGCEPDPEETKDDAGAVVDAGGADAAAVADGASVPDATVADAVVVPDAVVADTAVPDVVAADAVAGPDTAVLLDAAVRPDAGSADAWVPDSVGLDVVALPDGWVAPDGWGAPDGWVAPDAGLPDLVPVVDSAFAMDASVDAAVPDVTVTQLGICTANPAVIEAADNCLGDQDCPCGSYCELGRCQSDCLSDQACPANQHCDSFGRCRAATAVSLVPASNHEPEAQIEVLTPYALGTNASKTPIHLRVKDQAAGPIRIAAPDGIEVSCDGGVQFGVDCMVASAAEGQKVTIWVRPFDNPFWAHSNPSVAGTIGIYHGSKRTSASFTTHPVAADKDGVMRTISPVVDPPTLTSLAGVYEGTAQTTEMKIGTTYTAPYQGPQRQLIAKIFVTEGSSSGVLVIEDPSRSLHPDGIWIGSLENINLSALSSPAMGVATEVNGRVGRSDLDFEPHALYVGAIGASDAYPVVVQPSTSGRLAIRDNAAGGIAIDFVVEMAVRGLRGSSYVPTQVMRFQLQRRSDLEPSDIAPALPAAEPLPTVNSGAYTSFEQLIDDRYPSWHGSFSPQYDIFLEAYKLNGDTGSPSACFQPEERRDQLQEYLAKAFNPYTGYNSEEACPAPCTLDDVQYLAQNTDVNFTYVPQPMLEAIDTLIANSDYVGGGGSTLSILGAGRVERKIRTGAWIPSPDIIPCDNSGVSISGHFGSQQVEEPLPFTSCQELIDTYGCTLSNSELRFSQEPHFSLSGSGNFSGGSGWPVSLSYFFQLSGEWELKGCQMPDRPLRCGIDLACYIDGSSRIKQAGLADAPADRDDWVSGDLSCHTGRFVGLPFDRLLDLPTDDPDRLSAAELLETCATDLDAFMAELPSSISSPQELFSDASCVDPARLVVTLAQLSDTLTRDRESRRLALRLTQRWMHLHTFMARESLEAAQLVNILPVERPTPPALDEAVDRGRLAWDLLLHPRLVEYLFFIEGELVAEPDYRPAWSAESIDDPRHDHGVGLPVAMLDLATAQLNLAERLLDEAAYDPNLVDSGDAVAELMARIDTAQIFSTLLYQRALDFAVDEQEDLLWEEAYQRALEAMQLAHRRVSWRLIYLNSQANPLGIEDDDLPLYFLGNEDWAGGRFSAISDYLIGYSVGTEAWAPGRVAQAQAALEAARNAAIMQQDRQLAIAESEQENQDRLNAIKQRYGTVLADLCGRPGVVTTDAAMLEWEELMSHPFKPDICYIDINNSDCVIQEASYLDEVEESDIGFQMFRKSSYPFDPSFQHTPVVGDTASTLNEAVTYFKYCLRDTVQFPVPCVRSGGRHCITCSTHNGPEIELDITVDRLRSLSAPPEVAQWAVSIPNQNVHWAIAEAQAMGEFPEADLSLPPLEEFEEDETPASCFRGSIGEQALTVRAMVKDIEITQSRLNDHIDAYDIARSACDIQKRAAADISDAQANHRQTMVPLQRAKVRVEKLLSATQAVKDCASAGSAGILSVFSVGPGCTAAAAGAAFEIRLGDLKQEIEEATASHLAEVDRIQTQADLATCYKEAELELVGVSTASLEIERAVIELERSRLQLDNLKRKAQNTYTEGRLAVAEAQDSAKVPLAFDYWLDEHLSTYLRKMRMAKRVTYLGVRAVEYEYQMSMELRQDVFMSRIPDDLDVVIDTLREGIGSRSINGQTPSGSKAIISLRENLLQLVDFSAQRDDAERRSRAYKNLSDVQKLRLLLMDPRYAVHDRSTGAYKGQRIPFTLAPLVSMGLGTASDITIVAGNDCAERVWSVNANILGEPDLYVGSSTFVPIQLHKANTFFSQWCVAPGVDEPAFQVASVRPSRNLFREPGYGSDVGSVRVPEGINYTLARIDAPINIGRAEFEHDDYENGNTSELAARGLYGEYWLFIPTTSMTDYDADGNPTSNGIDFNKVDDILLRLDYVSVGRL